MEILLSVIRCPEGTAPSTWRSGGADVLVGRDQGCDWVLPDPERHLSKRHCVIEFRGGAWHLRDLSTNGTFLNHAAEPVGRDRSALLADGDRLRLGGYEIEVRIQGAAAMSVSGGLGAALDDPFASPPATAWPPAGGGLPPPAPLPPPLPDLDDPFRPLASAGAGMAQPVPPPSWPGAGGSPFDLDPVPPAASGLAYPAPTTGDPFGALPPVADHLPSGQEAFLPPRVTPGPQLLPEDWDLDPAELLPAGGAPAPAASPAPLLPAQAPAVPAGAGAAEALAAFLAAAGLPPGTVPSTPDPVAACRALGAAFGAAIAGLRALLVARGEVKREFRIEQTMLRAAGNNPLKFAPSDDAAVAQLLMLSEAAAGGAVRSVTDDLKVHQLATLAATQAAARALLDRLAPAAVEAQAAQSGAGGGLALLPGQRRARLWEDYVRLHQRLLAEFEDDFESAFGKAFARAYERAVAAAGGQRG